MTRFLVSWMELSCMAALVTSVTIFRFQVFCVVVFIPLASALPFTIPDPTQGTGGDDSSSTTEAANLPVKQSNRTVEKRATNDDCCSTDRKTFKFPWTFGEQAGDILCPYYLRKCSSLPGLIPSHYWEAKLDVGEQCTSQYSNTKCVAVATETIFVNTTGDDGKPIDDCKSAKQEPMNFFTSYVCQVQVKVTNEFQH